MPFLVRQKDLGGPGTVRDSWTDWPPTHQKICLYTQPHSWECQDSSATDTRETTYMPRWINRRLNSMKKEITEIEVGFRARLLWTCVQRVLGLWLRPVWTCVQCVYEEERTSIGKRLCCDAWACIRVSSNNGRKASYGMTLSGYGIVVFLVQVRKDFLYYLNIVLVHYK